MEKCPRIGLAAIIRKEKKVLMGLRRGSHQEGTFGLPGGPLDFLENPIERAVRREVLEETGLEVGRISFYDFTNDLMVEEGKHYVTLFYNCDYIGGEPKLMEPHKCSLWKWVNEDYLPGNLMVPVRNLIQKRYKL